MSDNNKRIKKRSTMRISTKAKAFFSILRSKKNERFGVTFTNDVLLDDILFYLEENPDALQAVLALAPGASKKEAPKEAASQ